MEMSESSIPGSPSLTLSPAWMRTRSDTRSPFTTGAEVAVIDEHELIAVAHESAVTT